MFGSCTIKRTARVQVVVSTSPEQCGLGSRKDQSCATLCLRGKESACVWTGIGAAHHRDFDGGAVLDIVNALRFAPTRPAAGPSGIDDAPRGTSQAITRWWSMCRIARTGLT